jgi:AsmA-like C-terminal region
MRRAVLLAVLALLALGAAYVVMSRGDPAARAGQFAAAVSREAGLPARVAGPAQFDGWWSPALSIARVEFEGIGALDDIAIAGDGAGSAHATLWGRAGVLRFDGARARFEAPDLTLEFARASRRLEAHMRFAGMPLVLKGRATMGGLAELSVDWAGIAGTGGLDRDGGVTLAGAAWRFDGRLAGDNALEGRLTGTDPALGAFEAPIRIDSGTIDVADARFAAGRATIGRQGGRWALDLRLGEIDLAKAAELLARGSGALGGDLDLRARAVALTWPSGRADGAILVAGRENDVWTVDEAAVRDIAGASLRVAAGTLELRAADAQRFLAAIGMPVERYLGELRASGRFDPIAAEISPVEIALAGQRLEGSLAWRNGRLKATLGGGRVDLDPFFVRAPPRPAQRGPLLTRSQQAQAARAAQPLAPGPGGWSRTPLGFDLAGAIPFDLDLKALELHVAGIAFAHAHLLAAFGREGIALESLTGTMLEGSAKLSGVWRGPPSPGFAAEFRLANVPFHRLLPALGAPPIFGGSSFLSGRLESSGATASILAGNLRGHVSIATSDVALRGLDLAALARRYAQPGIPPDIVELARLVARGGDSQLHRFDSELRVELGRARVASFVAQGPGTRIGGAGLVDIGNWSLDLAAEFAFAGKPAFALGAVGPIAAPRLSLRPAAGDAGAPAGSGAGSRPAVSRPASR